MPLAFPQKTYSLHLLFKLFPIVSIARDILSEPSAYQQDRGIDEFSGVIRHILSQSPWLKSNNLSEHVNADLEEDSI